MPLNIIRSRYGSSPVVPVTPLLDQIVIIQGRNSEDLDTGVSSASTTAFPSSVTVPRPMAHSWHLPLRASDSESAVGVAYHERESLHENPPAYVAARQPTKPVRYTFSPLTFNSMALVPPEDCQDPRPPYHISVAMNCFLPSSFVTTISRGATEHGELVGDFEMGGTQEGKVFIHDREVPIKDLLGLLGKRQSGYWTWNRNRQLELSWDFGEFGQVDNPAICRSMDREPRLLAKFYPAPKRTRRRESVPELEVFPDGFAHFDDLLMSLLIIERKRLSDGGTKKQFF